LAAADQTAEDLRRLQVDVETLFVHGAGGRILRTGSPDGGPAPRLFLASCAGGVIMRMRQDVSDEAAADLQAIVGSEPLWVDVQTAPACVPALVERLSRDAPATPAAPALIFHLPGNLAFATDATIIESGAPAGGRLLERLSTNGMPAHLIEAGFVSPDDLWAPWCAAIVDESIAALCFAARLGQRGAEAGVYTFPAYRRRGLAAAVTAAWSRLPALAGRTLFYSTLATNRSSQRVAERLGLRRFAVSLSIG
jgi:hypothetical protein